MALSIMLLALCLTAAISQVAVLRDRTIPEHEIVESLRYLRVAAYATTAVYVGYLLANGYWIDRPMAIAMIALALADTAGATCRLFPAALVNKR